MRDALARRLFTTDEYHRMAEAGILSEDDRVELIEGEIVRMSPIGRRHAACVARLTALFQQRLGKRAIVWIQNPIMLGRHAEPQADVALLKPRADFYAQRLPRPADVFLIIEVVETSGDYDRGRKLTLYARSGIAEVWIVDLPGKTVEQYRHPTLRGYRDRTEHARGERLALAALRATFRVNDLLVD